MEHNPTSNVETVLTPAIVDRIRNIRQWRERCQQLVNTIADDALETLTTVTTNDETLSENLSTVLIRRLNFDTQVSDDTLAYDNGTEYGGDDDDFSSCTMPSQHLWHGTASRQLSISSSTGTICDQAIYIKRTVKETYPCYKDSGNGVMALNEKEIVFVDWVLQKDGTGQLRMRVGSINDTIIESNEEGADNEVTNQDRLRIVYLPPEIQNMRAVDLEYAQCKSSYIIGLNPQYSKIKNTLALSTSWLYLFDSTRDIFEPWIPLANSHENIGLVNRICCCNDKPVVYLLINNFGNTGLLLLNEWGAIFDRKSASELIPDYENARFIDVTCTENNDLVAIAYNSSSRESEGRFGVRLWDPATWVRTYTLDLGIISLPYTVPRLAWLNQHDMFVLVNQLNGQLCVFDRNGDILGQRSFIVDVEGYEPPIVFPINICAARREFIAIRYTRFINIHRVNV